MRGTWSTRVIVLAIAGTLAVGCLPEEDGDGDGGTTTDVGTSDGGETSTADGGDWSAAPSIDSVSMQPNSVSESETQMTDECFTIDMQVSGFESEIEEIRVFVVDDPNRSATATKGDAKCSPSASATFKGSRPSYTVHGILTTMLEGLAPGDYPIGAEITPADGSAVTRRGVATITITDS